MTTEIDRILARRSDERAAARERAIKHFIEHPERRVKGLSEKQAYLERLQAQSELLGDLESDLEERRRRLDDDIEQTKSYLSMLAEAESRS